MWGGGAGVDQPNAKQPAGPLRHDGAAESGPNHDEVVLRPKAVHAAELLAADLVALLLQLLFIRHLPRPQPLALPALRLVDDDLKGEQGKGAKLTKN